MPPVRVQPCGPVASKPSANLKPRSKNTKPSCAKIMNGDASAPSLAPKLSPKTAGRRSRGYGLTPAAFSSSPQPSSRLKETGRCCTQPPVALAGRFRPVLYSSISPARAADAASSPMPRIFIYCTYILCRSRLLGAGCGHATIRNSPHRGVAQW